MSEARSIPDSCINCQKYIYKGEDEQYCQAAHMREMYLKRWQKKPKWCPMESRKRYDEWQKRKEEQNESNR